MVKNPADAAAVMPTNFSSDGAAPAAALPLTTNMTASSLTSGGNSCLDEQIERLKRCEYLREGEVKALCLRAREILVDESNVQRVDAPVTVRQLLAPSVSFPIAIVGLGFVGRNNIINVSNFWGFAFRLCVFFHYYTTDMRRHSWAVL
jgi:hypothetical protein